MQVHICIVEGSMASKVEGEMVEIEETGMQGQIEEACKMGKWHV